MAETTTKKVRGRPFKKKEPVEAVNLDAVDKAREIEESLAASGAYAGGGDIPAPTRDDVFEDDDFRDEWANLPAEPDSERTPQAPRTIAPAPIFTPRGTPPVPALLQPEERMSEEDPIPMPPAAGTAPRASSRVVGAPTTVRGAPTKVNQVVPNQEKISLYLVNDGKQSYIMDYTAEEIGLGGGNIEAFIQQWVAPKMGGGGFFRATQNTNRGPAIRWEGWVGTKPPQPGQAPEHVGVHVGPSVTDQATGFAAMMGAVSSVSKTAREEAAAQAEAEQRRMDALMSMLDKRREAAQPTPGNGGGGQSMMDTLLMMRMLEPPKTGPDPASAAVKELSEGLGQVFTALDQRLARIESAPPPMMPMAPAPIHPREWVEALLEPALRVYQTTQAAKKGPEDYIAMFAGLIPILAQVGLVGGPKITATDLMLAELKAKLEAQSQKPDVNPMDYMMKMAEFIEVLRPSSDPWVGVAEKLIDTAPALFGEVRSMQELKTVMQGGAGKTPSAKRQITQKGGKKVEIPAALADLRKTVLETDPQANYNMDDGGKTVTVQGAILILQAVGRAAGPLISAGEPWAQATKDFLEATCSEDLEGCAQALAKLLKLAWGAKDSGAVTMGRRIMGIWKSGIKQIAPLVRKMLGRAEPEQSETEQPKPEEEEEEEEEDEELADLLSDGEAPVAESAQQQPVSTPPASGGVPELDD